MVRYRLRGPGRGVIWITSPPATAPQVSGGDGRIDIHKSRTSPPQIEHVPTLVIVIPPSLWLMLISPHTAYTARSRSASRGYAGRSRKPCTATMTTPVAGRAS